MKRTITFCIVITTLVFGALSCENSSLKKMRDRFSRNDKIDNFVLEETFELERKLEFSGLQIRASDEAIKENDLFKRSTKKSKSNYKTAWKPSKVSQVIESQDVDKTPENTKSDTTGNDFESERDCEFKSSNIPNSEYGGTAADVNEYKKVVSEFEDLKSSSKIETENLDRKFEPKSVELSNIQNSESIQIDEAESLNVRPADKTPLNGDWEWKEDSFEIRILENINIESWAWENIQEKQNEVKNGKLQNDFPSLSANENTRLLYPPSREEQRKNKNKHNVTRMFQNEDGSRRLTESTTNRLYLESTRTNRKLMRYYAIRTSGPPPTNHKQV